MFVRRIESLDAKAVAGISQYLHSKLDRVKCEIRLLALLPSRNFEDPIRITATHISFNPLNYVPRPEVDEEAVEREFPEGWFAHQTIEGRVLFGMGESINEQFVDTVIQSCFDTIPADGELVTIVINNAFEDSSPVF